MNYILIPARLNSKRLPGKALLEVNGKTLIHHTYNKCKLASEPKEVYIVTDNEKILRYCRDNELKYIKSNPASNGTLRCADRLQYLNNPRKIINVQLDYPQICSKTLDYIFNLLDNYDVVTPYYYGCITEIQNQNNVKLIRSIDGDLAIWFSRQSKSQYIHIGIYGFKSYTLELLSDIVPTNEAINEKLEQLTWLQHRQQIKCFKTEPTISINTQEDFDKFKKQTEPSSGK